MENCIFCKIVAGEAPARVVYESDTILGFAPINEVAMGHSLLIPRAHFRDLFDMDEAVLADLSVAAKSLATQLIFEHGATGVNLLHASGVDAQQSVFHFHLHVVPRYPDDGLNLWIRQGL